jgi:hypothetical protein
MLTLLISQYELTAIKPRSIHLPTARMCGHAVFIVLVLAIGRSLRSGEGSRRSVFVSQIARVWRAPTPDGRGATRPAHRRPFRLLDYGTSVQTWLDGAGHRATLTNSVRSRKPPATQPSANSCRLNSEDYVEHIAEERISLGVEQLTAGTRMTDDIVESTLRRNSEEHTADGSWPGALVYFLSICGAGERGTGAGEDKRLYSRS